MTPQLSLVAGFRNREIDRVTRFLDSLQRQTYRDFELLFVDYGSDPSMSSAVAELCMAYPYCQYIFCDTRGMIWNRAHALNIGIQRARGKYFLSADIDLIYSENVLSCLISACREHQQVFCRAFLLPKIFTDYPLLSQRPVAFPLTKNDTLGLFHCVLMEHVKSIGGYDEYYRIWGFEDKDFAKRLEVHGLESVWLDETQCPVYHQWHPAGRAHVFMQWWWEEMTLYDSLTTHDVKPERTSGVLITAESRSLNHTSETIEYVCPLQMNPFERRASIFHIVNLLRENPGKRISVVLYKDSAQMRAPQHLTSRSFVRLANVMNKCLRYFGSTTQMRVFNASTEKSANFMLYFFYLLILKSDALLDYAFVELPDRYLIDMLSAHKEVGNIRRM